MATPCERWKESGGGCSGWLDSHRILDDGTPGGRILVVQEPAKTAFHAKFLPPQAYLKTYVPLSLLPFSSSFEVPIYWNN